MNTGSKEQALGGSERLSPSSKLSVDVLFKYDFFVTKVTKNVHENQYSTWIS